MSHSIRRSIAIAVAVVSAATSMSVWAIPAAQAAGAREPCQPDAHRRCLPGVRVGQRRRGEVNVPPDGDPGLPRPGRQGAELLRDRAADGHAAGLYPADPRSHDPGRPGTPAGRPSCTSTL